jgi:hypothetical protein
VYYAVHRIQVQGAALVAQHEDDILAGHFYRIPGVNVRRCTANLAP